MLLKLEWYDTSGPFRTISNKKLIVCSKAPLPNPTLSLWGNKLIFVWNGPKVSRWAQKGSQIVKKTHRFTISDPFGPLWITLECWQACHVRPFLFVLLVRFFWDTQYLFHFFFGNFCKVDPRAPTDDYSYVISLWNWNSAKEEITDPTEIAAPPVDTPERPSTGPGMRKTGEKDERDRERRRHPVYCDHLGVIGAQLVDDQLL